MTAVVRVEAGELAIKGIIRLLSWSNGQQTRPQAPGTHSRLPRPILYIQPGVF